MKVRLFALAGALTICASAIGAPHPPVTALAYRPDGKVLAAGVRGEVVLIDAGSGSVSARVATAAGHVTALAFSRDGKWLAVAGGTPGKAGQVQLIDAGASVSPTPSTAAHADLVHQLAFSPDGKTLATCSYDRLIKLWTIGERGVLTPRLTLKDHSDSVYGISFRPDGKLLASAAADRAVKIWDTSTGTRLYSLGDPTDWVYAVAWSPDGKHLAAAGVDKSIRVWEANEKEGKLVRTAFAHDKPVLKLEYSADGKTLYSASEDRTVKAWEASTLAEKQLYAAQPESVLAFALRPDGQQLALGRYDGVCVLLDVNTGKVTAQPLPEKPKPPKISKLTPDVVMHGQLLVLTFDGENLAGVTDILTTAPGVHGKRAADPRAGKVSGAVPIPRTIEPGTYQVRVKSAAGESNALTLIIDRFAASAEPNGTESPRSAPTLQPQRTIEGGLILQSTIAGGLSRAGEVDFYRLNLKAGQEVGVQAQAPPGSKLEPVLSLEDSSGNILVESDKAALGYRCERDGTFLLALRDREYRGGAEFKYRLHIGEIPIVTSSAPLGIQRGTEAVVHVRGVHVGGDLKVAVKAPAGAAVGSRIPVPISSTLGAVLNAPSLVVGEFPESEWGQPLAVPGTGRGVIAQPGAVQTWRFRAKKGETLIVEVEARRIGSPLDSVIEILDAAGKPVEHALARCVAKTFVTFRDHDSAGSGIRMETWNEFAMDDYVMVGNELMRIRELPKNPDDDCQFYSVNGQRLGYFGTTPAHHALGTPMFKVSLHPPGSMLPSNGMPVFSLVYRNDDGGPGYGKDSRLRFDPPADGEYQVRVGDARGFGGLEYGYRVTVRAPRPNFSVRFLPTAPSVWKGGAVPMTATADRFDDFDGRIQLRLENLPPGFSAPSTFIEAGQNSTTFALYAEPTAVNPDAKLPPLKLVASALIAGKTVTREATGALPKLVEPGDIVTTTAQSTVTIRPGQETRLLVHVERRNGFKGRIPLEVQGLPHGVRVLHIGLNGILVTERDSSREIFIYAEPWVQPMDHPFVVLARREGKGTEHAAKSVLLKVEK